jgi:hypothetical protein
VPQAVENLPSKQEALSLITSTTTHKKNTVIISICKNGILFML